jgi:hypothetical protein
MPRCSETHLCNARRSPSTLSKLLDRPSLDKSQQAEHMMEKVENTHDFSQDIRSI